MYNGTDFVLYCVYVWLSYQMYYSLYRQGTRVMPRMLYLVSCPGSLLTSVRFRILEHALFRSSRYRQVQLVRFEHQESRRYEHQGAAAPSAR